MKFRGGGITHPPPRIKREGQKRMGALRKFAVKIREFPRGQTMTEYALILTAVAVVVFIGYQTLGTTIGPMLSLVDSNI
jgi:Flp pilus assembly pilin Flp